MIVGKKKPEAQAVSPVPHGTALNMHPDLRVLFIGDTASGKSTQLAALAKYQATTGEGKTTVVMLADRGSMKPYLPHIAAGIVKVYKYHWGIDPWIWLSHAIRGEAKLLDGNVSPKGKWENVLTEDVGLLIGESLTGFAELLMIDMGRISANEPDRAVGGESAWKITATDGEETLKIAGSTMSHYGLAQLRITEEIFRTDVGIPSVWTAGLQRTADKIDSGGVLAAQIVGKAIGPSVPRWFDMTLRINAEASMGGAEHILHLDTHLDKLAKGAKVIANARIPMEGRETAPVASRISPADIVQALLQVQRRDQTAANIIRQEREAFLKGRKKG